MESNPVMTDWSLLWRLGPLVILAAIVGVPAQIRAVAATRGAPPPSSTAWMAPIAALVVVGLAAAAVGTAAAARVGLQAPALHPGAGTPVPGTLIRHLAWGTAAGLAVAALSIPFYYGVMRPLFDPHGFSVVENVRRGMGLPGRIAIGGVLEEVVYRWGALALFAWIGLKLTGEVGPEVRWGSILAAGLLFGLAHLPGGVALGVRMGPALVLASLAVNGLLGIVAGWLVWHQGLLAAMAAHASVHVVWWVVESAPLG